MTDATEPVLAELSAAERAWVDGNVRAANAFVEMYAGVEVADGAMSAALLDHAWAAWLRAWSAQNEGAREDPNAIISAVGVAFGQLLVDAVGLEWRIVTDAYGTDLAVHGAAGNVVIVPANLVAKRFASRTTGFCEPVFAGLCAEVRRLRGS